ncbi:hypothetical protein O6H91_05G048200 [Diphasiastrum complanatum]|uniref:Uncharacterized protein n=2 Tax=Diphasiastrum complanatum TaxID=34168 RepID=A0ACC2DMX1_DIPCM|nr:hypothetical protein O6H91_05G048200 [Diphasiastrum complanatum]KAJ7555645.1 hypothetical protein O6H91_05G048200 [Diphasiastrum complanatum]
MDKRISLESSRKLVVALACNSLLLTVIIVLNHVTIHGNHSLLTKAKSTRFHPANDQFSSVDRSSSRHLKEQPRLLTSLRSGNLYSVRIDLLRVSLLQPPLSPPPPPAPAPISADSHGCERVCGEVPIPYPFGLSPECARSSGYELSCIDSNSTLAKQNLEDSTGPWPFLSTPSGSFQITSIASGNLIINTTKIKAMPSRSQGGDCSDLGNASLVLDPNGPYIISPANYFFVAGCRSVGGYSLDFPLNSFNFGNGNNDEGICGPISCTNQHQNPFCNAYDCCTLSVTASRKIYLMGKGISFSGQSNCGFCSILYPPSYSTWNGGLIGVGQYGVQLLWAIQEYKSCAAAITQLDYACFPSPASCSDVSEVPGYVCECTATGYHGDGYNNGTGCTDINECADASLNDCAENSICTNYPGSYNCSCGEGLTGDGYRNSTGCTHPKSHLALIAGVSSGVGSFLLMNAALIWCLWRRRQNGLDDSYEMFQPSNISFHATLMEIQKQDGANVCKIFSLKELKQATDNFSPDHELGKGGFGTVFQGVLEDGMKVAIKKPKNDVGGRRDDTKQFINEVTILSQVNHRNLVRLLGCCLETRAPLLVYEYVSNGTLLEHLQSNKKIESKNLSVLDWDKRLDIAVGTAEALNYLHFGTSPPIYHRDVKSSNILLDDKYRAKVADFGLSRLVPIEATHVSTMLQGTPGYLDPEYFHNLQITDKSDVYSFGVVLLELITAEKPVDLSREPEDQNLVVRFSRLLKEARLEDMFDVALDASFHPQMLEALYRVAKVALKCVQRSREYRPSMKEVLDELLVIRKSYKGLSESTISVGSLEQDWLPLKLGMSDSSMDFDFGSYSSSLRSTSFPFYRSNTSSYANASGSSIELSQR